MSHECHGIWRSYINPDPTIPPLELGFPPNDLWFNVNREDDDGHFTGNHLGTLAHLSGKCSDSTESIEFYRFEEGRTFRYYGDIEPDPLTGVLIARGTRTEMMSEGFKFEKARDDVWVGVKTT